jgi:hypothetical protein
MKMDIAVQWEQTLRILHLESAAIPMRENNVMRQQEIEELSDESKRQQRDRIIFLVRLAC